MKFGTQPFPENRCRERDALLKNHIFSAFLYICHPGLQQFAIEDMYKYLPIKHEMRENRCTEKPRFN